MNNNLNNLNDQDNNQLNSITNSNNFNTMNNEINNVNASANVKPNPNININQEMITPKNNLPNNNGVNHKSLFIIAFVLIVVAVIVGYIFISKNGNNEDNDITKSSAFFIKNKEGNYALFNEDGKQLSDFEYKSASSFNNGSAVVKKDNHYGIIKENGKMTVNFGKYTHINSKGALFETTDTDNNHFLINSRGKVLYDLKGINIHNFIGENTYLLLESDKDYNILNYNGKSITSFKKADNDDVDSPSANSKDNYASIFYNNTNYIVDTKNNKLILKFNDSKHFCINSVNKKDESEVILNSCVGNFETQDTNNFKFLKNGKLIYEKNDSEFSNIAFDENGNVKAYTNQNLMALLNEKGLVGLNLEKNSHYTQYYDYKNYAQSEDYWGRTANIYKDGKLIKTLDCAKVPQDYNVNLYYKIYKFTGCGEEYKYQFYNADGSLLTDKFYSIAGHFNSYGLSIVSEDKENYYLINIDGKKVSKDYLVIKSFDNNYYSAKTAEDTYVLIDGNGNELIKSDDNIELHKYKTELLATIKSNGSYSIYNLKQKKTIAENISSRPPRMDTNFLIAYTNGKNQYYSYTTGKLFYEQQIYSLNS